HADRIGKIYAVYVTDAQGRLTGYLKLRDLLLQDRAARVGDIQRDNPVSVRADSDRAEAAREAEARALPVLPVVDSGGRLIGRITAQELREIDRAEADEDRMIMAGVRVGATATDSVLEIVPRRLPWLAAGLIGAGIAALVVGRHEAALTEAAILASLIPIVMSLAGNAGIQASTVTVQAQTSGAFWTGDLPMRIVREAAGALLNGLAVGLLVAGAVLTLGAFAVIDRPGALAATAGVTLVLVTVQAAVVGTLVPVALDRLGFDPAVATGVFITTSNDVVGVLIFFLIATTLYL
ncbi:MAG: magnesium transporter, partial [Pseudomonadota bacterium]